MEYEGVEYKVALVQMTSKADFEVNLRHAISCVAEAASNGAKLIAFPEVFLLMSSHRDKLRYAEEINGSTVKRFTALAAKYGVYINLGSIYEKNLEDTSRVYNTSIFIDSDGQIIAHYQKLNLFDVDLPDVQIRESQTISAGTERPPVVQTELGNMALTICFDLRFPELYVDIRERGANIIMVPSNFTYTTGKAHWEVLLRARAIENQSFVIAAAQTGQHNAKYRSYGHSMVVDPWGTVLVDGGESMGIFYADIVSESVRKVRDRLPMRW